MVDKKGAQKGPRGIHVALLRGINVGGKNKLPMTALVEIFKGLGCADVRTYIQSGNVVFSASDALVRRIPTEVAATIEKKLGLTVPVITRSLDEWRTVATTNPFMTAGQDTKKLHVAFLASTPDDANVAAVDPDRSPPDEIVVRGKEIYLFYPNGVARTKLTNAYFDSKLATTSTVRNWNTVLKLLSLAGSKLVP